MTEGTGAAVARGTSGSEKPDWLRVLEIVLGLFAIIVTIAVVVNQSYDETTIIVLTGFLLALNAIRLLATTGARQLPKLFRRIGLAGGLILVVLFLFIVLSPSLGLHTVIFVLAGTLVIQAAVKILHFFHKSHPTWFRASSAVVGGMTLVFAIVALTIPGLGTVSLVALLAVALGVYGFDSIISGIKPGARRQQLLIKLIIFALIYGFINVNWIDLYYNSVPGYHIWLILTYMAPFGVLLVFQGLKDWELALSLGLLVSLMNDVGYFISGDLLFGFHVALVPWLEGQLGFLGGKVLFYFQGGVFSFPVTSALMGLSIYGRVFAVAIILLHWWRSTGKRAARAPLSA